MTAQPPTPPIDPGGRSPSPTPEAGSRPSRWVWVTAAIVGVVVLVVGISIVAVVMAGNEVSGVLNVVETVESVQESADDADPPILYARTEAFDLCTGDIRISEARYGMDLPEDAWCSQPWDVWFYQVGLYREDIELGTDGFLTVTWCDSSGRCESGLGGMQMQQEYLARGPYADVELFPP
jgi:hypothetical protein